MREKFTKAIAIFSLMIILSVLAISTVHAQGSNYDDSDEKNLVKWNVGALLLKNFSFQYERALTQKISGAIGIRFSPKAKVPFSSALKNAIDDEETWGSIKNFKTGNFAITPEVRFYLGKDVFRGFYVAPFIRFANYTAAVPYSFDVEDGEGNSRTEVIQLDGKVNSFTGGVLFGAQWKVAKRFAIDWWILGPNYGTSNGNIAGNKALNQQEQDALRETLMDLEDLPIVKTKSSVDANGARVDFNGPWAGLRAGISIGFRF
nr:DUF3575 domain-containing protein [Pedobacter panaciterrae]